MRAISNQYADPLDLIWIHAARRMGLRIQRSNQVFASWNGRDTLTLGVPESLDPDDSLAQLVFHEICHALCEWPDGFRQPDWGLESDNPAHRVREHACLRLQAALSQRFGLRQFLAATTVFRRYYDKLPTDPLLDDGDPAVAVARQALLHLQSNGWKTPLENALSQTAQIADILKNVVGQDSLWATANQSPR